MSDGLPTGYRVRACRHGRPCGRLIRSFMLRTKNGNFGIYRVAAPAGHLGPFPSPTQRLFACTLDHRGTGRGRQQALTTPHSLAMPLGILRVRTSNPPQRSGERMDRDPGSWRPVGAFGSQLGLCESRALTPRQIAPAVKPHESLGRDVRRPSGQRGIPCHILPLRRAAAVSVRDVCGPAFAASAPWLLIAVVSERCPAAAPLRLPTQGVDTSTETPGHSGPWGDDGVYRCPRATDRNTARSLQAGHCPFSANYAHWMFRSLDALQPALRSVGDRADTCGREAVVPRLRANSLFHVKHDRTVCGYRRSNCRCVSLRKRWRDFCGMAHPARSEFVACRIRNRWTTSIISDWDVIYRRSLSFSWQGSSFHLDESVVSDH